MPQDILIRILLLPISLLYGIGVALRGFLYRIGVLKSVRFDLPVISVGNLSVGGAGKSPHIEFLMRWLHEYLQVAVLSRGYGRSTVGFRPVTIIDTADTVGDEPLQFKRKFPEIPILVSESRALAIPEIVKRYPDTQAVLLDDAFQHLAVTPGLNVLLTEFSRPFTRDFLLPTGRLREWKNCYRRADLIVVTKCPPDISEKQKVDLVAEIDPYPWQKVFFSKYRYGPVFDLLRPDVAGAIDLETDVLLVSAIASTDYLLSFLKKEVRSVHTLEFADHHYFTNVDLLDLLGRFKNLPSRSGKKIILTTEKDATRLEMHRDFFFQNQLPVFVLPVEVEFLGSDDFHFKNVVRQFLLDFKV